MATVRPMNNPMALFAIVLKDGVASLAQVGIESSSSTHLNIHEKICFAEC